MSRRNYREIFTSVRAYAQTVGREIPFELEAGDPAVLGNILNYLQNTTGNEVFFLEEDGTSSFWLAESLLTCESLAVPLAPTYEEMGPAFGRTVRRFIATVFRNAGLEPAPTLVAYHGDYLLEEADGLEEEARSTGEPLSVDEKRYNDYVRSYFSKKPGSIGARLSLLKKCRSLSVEELRRAKPRTEYEKEVHSLLLEGERFLDEHFDLLSGARFEVLDADWACSFFPSDLYIAVVWDNGEDGILDRCIEMINGEYGSGCEDNGLYHWRRVGPSGPIDKEDLEENSLLRFLEKLSWKL